MVYLETVNIKLGNRLTMKETGNHETTHYLNRNLEVKFITHTQVQDRRHNTHHMGKNKPFLQG